MDNLTHFDTKGNAIMVDVSEKSENIRIAKASGKIFINDIIIDKIKKSDIKKGDVLGVARVAGIMAVKKTYELIPMCHSLLIEKCSIDFEFDEISVEKSIKCICEVKITGKTGVEMEALTGVNIALLTIYDMCKAIDKSMQIGEIHLESKIGGKSGNYIFTKNI